MAILGFAASGAFVYKERGRVIANGRTAAARLSQLLEEQTLRTLQAVDLTLLGIVDTLAVTPTLKPHDRAFEDALRRKRDQLPFVRALFVIGPDGFITQDTDVPTTPNVSLADRDYFRIHRDDPSVGLHIGSPLISRSIGTWFISMSRRLHSRDGEFRGIAVAAVSPRYFERFYARLHLVEGDSIALFHTDGRLYSRIPYREDQVGASFVGLPLFQDQLPARPEGIFRASQMDGVPRIVSYRTVEGLPLVVVVGVAETPLLAGWRRTTIGALGGTSVLVALAGAVLVLLAREIRQRETMREHLAQAQRLEALGRMTGGIAHDFANVLNVIATNLDLVRRDAGRAAEPVEAAIRAVRQGTRLGSQLLAFARRQNLIVEPRDANRLVASLRPLLEQAAGSSVDVTLDLADDLWPCLTDDVQLNTAILNLAINARDAMPRGKGVIRITTRNRSITGGWSRRTLPAGDYVELTVADDGSGMPSGVLQHAAEPFYTTKEGAGTGLGLSQVYGFTHQVGGGLHIESTVGVGTTVRLFFRRAADARPGGADSA